MYNIWHQSGILQFVDYTYEFYFPFFVKTKKYDSIKTNK